jgi:hypothetical protein
MFVVSEPFRYVCDAKSFQKKLSNEGIKWDVILFVAAITGQF